MSQQYLYDLIRNCLERKTVATSSVIAKELEADARKMGRRPWSEGTIQNRLKELKSQGMVEHQEQGFVIKRSWKEEQPKAFILVEVGKPTEPRKNNQKELVEEIRKGFRQGNHINLNLISVDVVMGAEFSVIVQVYSDHLHFIGLFVKEYLLTHSLVTNTRTIMVWPSEASEFLAKKSSQGSDD